MQPGQAGGDLGEEIVQSGYVGACEAEADTAASAAAWQQQWPVAAGMASVEQVHQAVRLSSGPAGEAGPTHSGFSSNHGVPATHSQL